MEETRRRLNELIERNHSRLLAVASNITKNRDKGNNLLHEVVIGLHDKLSTNSAYMETDTDFVKYVTKYIKNTDTWARNNTYNFRKDTTLYTYCPPHDSVDISDWYTEEAEDDSAEALIYIDAENTSDVTKMFLKDMLSNNIPIEKGLMVNKIHDAVKRLDMQEREMFYLFYIRELTCLDIHKHLNNLSQTPIGYHRLLALQKQVRKKILEMIR